MRFNLKNGFPCITNRNIGGFWRGAIGELCAFINGATTLSEFEEFGCNWWGPWASEEKCVKRGLPIGDLGPGSYGGAFYDWPDWNGGSYDQFEHPIAQIRENPGDRTHVVSPWNGALLARDSGRINKATIAPCHGWLQVRIMNGKIHLHHTQRSGDVPIGIPSNMVQYGALLLMLEHLTGYKAGYYTHYIVDAHIYSDQTRASWEIVNRSDLRLPTVNLNEAGKEVDDIHNFRAEHFEISDYHAHPAMKGIPVAT
jgi:thymidylate synthase